jgi:transcription initiation factor IIF auxiliary subunit
MGSDVKCFVLCNGEHIVATVDEEYDDGNYAVSNPFQIAVMPPRTPDEAPSIALVPWVQYAKLDATVIYNHSLLIAPASVDDRVREYYDEILVQLGKKIITPDKKIVV